VFYFLKTDYFTRTHIFLLKDWCRVYFELGSLFSKRRGFVLWFVKY